MDDHPAAARVRLVVIPLIGLFCFGLAPGGCATPKGRFVDCPLSTDQQQQAVGEIVPVGTSRNLAAQRLSAAGIEFTTAAGDSIYYCAAWKRPDGTRWHMNVALLFDGENKLYQLREANSTSVPATTGPNGNRDAEIRTGSHFNSAESTGASDSAPVSDRIPFSR